MKNYPARAIRNYVSSSSSSSLSSSSRRRFWFGASFLNGHWLFPTLLAILVIGFWAEPVASEELCQQHDSFGNETTTTASNSDDYTIGSLHSNGAAAAASLQNTADAILFPWFVQFIGCCVFFLLARYNLPVPYAACMFVVGALMGILAVRMETLLEKENNVDVSGGAADRLTRHYLQDSILTWINIDSSLLLLIFLPGLIFKDAVEIPIHLFLVAAGKCFVSFRFVSPQPQPRLGYSLDAKM